MWDLKQNATYPEESKDYSYIDRVQTHFDIPDYPNGAMLAPLMALAQERGCRVLLTGYGGDEWLTGINSQCPDLLRQLNILGWARQAFFESRRLNRNRFYSFKIMMDSFRPLAPEVLRRHVRKTHRNGRSFDGLSQYLIASTRLADRLASRDTGDHVTGIARRSRYQRLSYGSLVHGREMQDRFVSRFGLEDRHPFQDRRVVEYAFALPEQQIHRRDESKFILRKAMKGIIPESVRRRVTKADFSHVFPKALQTQGGESAFSSLMIGSLDWVDEEKVRSVYKQMASLYNMGDQGYTRYMWTLWMVFGMELWIRTVFADKRASFIETTAASQIEGTEARLGNA